MSKDHTTDEHKEKFQMERIALFSDAVFAIAITLLIIEIKVPAIHGGEVTDHALLEGLDETLPKFVGFFVSFFVIGLYWLSHHRLFRYVVRSSQKLLWANLLFLLPIVVMPFSTAFLSEYYDGRLKLPLGLYMVNTCFTGLFSYRLWRIIGNPKNHLSEGLNKTVLSYNTTRALTIPAIFICVFLLSFISPLMAYLIPPFVPFATGLIKRYYQKKYPGVMKDHM